MAVKSLVVETVKRNEINYPCLMKCKHSEVIVLFTEKGQAVAVCDGSNTSLGYYSTEWDMLYYAPFNGKVTLENG